MPLKIDSIRKSFDHRPILRDVFLACEKGQIVDLFGRNGSGKSTLLKIVYKQIDADHCHVSAYGNALISAAEISQYINYLPQENMLPSNEKAHSLIKVFVHKKWIEYVENLPEIKPLLHHKCKTLSFGPLRSLEILLVLYGHGQYALLDEPFHGLAPLLVDQIKVHIQQASKTKGIILTDHSYRNVLDIATDMFVLVDGRTHSVQNQEDLRQFGYLPSFK